MKSIISRVGFIALSLLVSSSLATVIPGGNLPTQTWTTAGSPYIVQGDATVQSGATLTINAGVVVQFASSDSQASGQDTSRVELIIRGVLNVNGTAAQPVSFQAQSGTAPATWYGIEVLSTATSVTINHADIRHAVAGVLNTAAGSVTTINDSNFTLNNIGVATTVGTPIIHRITASSNGVGLDSEQAGGFTITDGFFASNASAGIYFNNTSAGTSTITHCTLSGNGSYGIYSSNSTVNVYNSIIVSGTGYGVYRNSGTVSVTYSDIWNNATADFFGAAAGTGCISANPLLTSATDPHLLVGSPCIDTGDPSHTSSPDLYGTARPIDGNGVGGAQPDMGAVEAGCPYGLINITVPPVAVATSLGHSFSFSVTAPNATTFQWRFNGSDMSNGRGISGVTTAQLTVDFAGLYDAGGYTVYMTNPCGNTQTSTPVPLTVGPACGSADFNGDGDRGTDADIEAFFRVLAGGNC